MEDQFKEIVEFIDGKTRGFCNSQYAELLELLVEEFSTRIDSMG